MLAELEQRLLKELRVRGDGNASLEMLRRRAATVRSLTGNFRLDALATRLSSFAGSLEELEGLARSEEHTSELQSLMRISYAVFCLKKNKRTKDIVKRIN